jgi:hypothetical protein
MTQRFDPSLINLLATGTGSAPVATGRTEVASLIDEAVNRVVDWIAGGDRRSARVCVDAGNDRTWILLDTYTPQGSSELHYTARTNDMDLFVATPPTFHVTDTDPGAVHTACSEFLVLKYAGMDLTVRIFRTEGNRQEPIEEATSSNGAFRELPEFPSL